MEVGDGLADLSAQTFLQLVEFGATFGVGDQGLVNRGRFGGGKGFWGKNFDGHGGDKLQLEKKFAILTDF